MQSILRWITSVSFLFCSPYHYGYITELKAVGGSAFAYENVKHYTMGRISHEMGCACCNFLCSL